MCLFIVLETHWYFAAGRDDIYISLWSGYGLAHGYGFVNYNLQPLEVSSSFLHVLFIALLWLIAPEHVYVLNKLLGLVFGLLTLVVVYRSSAVFFPHFKNAVYGSLAVIILLLSSIVWMYWNLGGLENAIVTFLIVCFARVSMECWQRSVIQPGRLGAITALLVLVRSEGFLYIAALVCFVTLWWWTRKRLNRALLLLLAIPIVTQCILTLWRWFSFHALFPNPTYAKVSFGGILRKMNSGWTYLVSFYWNSPFHGYLLISLLFFVVLLFSQGKRQPNHFSNIPLSYSILLGIVVLNHFFIVLVGKDWMELYRFVQPVIPLLTIIAVGWFGWVFGQIKSSGTESTRHPHDIVQFVGLAVLATVLIYQVSVFRGSIGTTYAAPLLTVVMIVLGGLLVAGMWLRGTDKKVLVGMFVLMSLSALVVLPRDFDHLSMRKFVCGKPMDTSVLYAGDPGILLKELHQKNCAHHRDDTFIAQYITPQYAKFAEQHNNQVSMRSGQGGYIPYYLKTTYPSIEFMLIDDFGLNDAYIARLKQTSVSYKSSVEFKEYLDKTGVNIWYTLPITDKQMDRRLTDNPEWEVSFRSKYGVVLVKK